MAKTTIKLIIASIMISVACIANAQSRKANISDYNREEKHLLNKLYSTQKQRTYTSTNIAAATRLLEIKDNRIDKLENRIRELEVEIARYKWCEEAAKRQKEQNNRLKYRDSRDYKTNIRMKMASQKRK